MAIYQLRTLKDIVDAVREELKIPASDTSSIQRIKRDVNMVYLNEVVPFEKWNWLRGFVDQIHESVIATGDCDITANSRTVTLSTTIAISVEGYWFSLLSTAERYRVQRHVAGSATLTLEVPYTGSTLSDQSYQLWADWVVLPSDCRETIEVTCDGYSEPLEGCGLQKFRKYSNTYAKAQGKPQFYSVSDWIDPSPYSAISGLPAAVSRASDGLVRTLTFASSIEAYLEEGSRIQVFGAGDGDYNGDWVVNSVTSASLTFTALINKQESTTADVAYSAYLYVNERDSERYRRMLVYPSLNTSRTVLHIDYIKDVIPLEEDADEPLIPIEDRIVLFYGACSRAWSRERNPEESAKNQALYDRKLSKMSGKLDDSTDTPILRPSRVYLGTKRSAYRYKTDRYSPISFSGSGNNAAGPVFGTPYRIAFFNASGNLDASTLTVTSTGVLTGGIAAITSFSATYAAITTLVADTLTATDLDASAATLTSAAITYAAITDTDITSAAISYAAITDTDITSAAITYANITQAAMSSISVTSLIVTSTSNLMGTATVGSLGSTTTHIVYGSQLQLNGNTAGSTEMYVTNQSTTIGYARLYVQVSGTAADDPLLVWSVTGGSNWAAGIDNGDSDTFKLGVGSFLPASSPFQVTTAGAVTLGSTSSTATHIIQGNILQLTGASTSDEELQITNTQTSIGGAKLTLTVGGTSAGDPYVAYAGAATTWVSGVDNSDSDAFKIGTGTALGSLDLIRIGTDGILTVASTGSTVTHVINGSFTVTNSNSAAVVWSFQKDATAGATTAAASVTIGNQSAAQGRMNFQYLNKAATAATTFRFRHSPRNNADSSNADVVLVDFNKSAGSDGGDIIFQTATTAGTLTTALVISNTQTLTMGTGTAGTHRLNTLVATGATAGADTLPGNPVGFVVININGTDRKIPYYAT